MKNTHSISKILAAFLVLSFLISCTNDTEFKPQENQDKNLAFKSNLSGPDHSANTYDNVGKIHNEILTAYFLGKNLPHTTNAIRHRVDSIANSNTAFILLTPHHYQYPESSKLHYILEQKITCATDIITGIDISISAKSSLSNFISAMFAYSNSHDEYPLIYDFIIDYETGIIDSKLYSDRDKEVLLVVTSIARHSMYAKKKRPKKNMDPDWDFLVGNIIASTEGARFGRKEAIILSLTAGIAENPN